jgi:Fe2+ transport system protein FeoA
VVRIGETELALDSDIARGIMVERVEKDPATP